MQDQRQTRAGQLSRDDGGQQPNAVQEGNSGSLKGHRGRRKPRHLWEMEGRPIRMMKTKPEWDYVKEFKSAPVQGLTWGQLFNLAASLRAGCASGIVMGGRPGKKK